MKNKEKQVDRQLKTIAKLVSKEKNGNAVIAYMAMKNSKILIN